MKIVFDLMHPAHLNFFKNAIIQFANEGNQVIITVLRRGKLPDIIKKELPGIPVKYVGKHRETKFSIIFEANIKKFFSLFFFLIGRRIDIGVSVGSFVLGAVCKLLGKPNIQFDDDPERNKNVFLEKLTCSVLFFPPIVETGGKIKTMNALKEWAYLSPKYFTPRESELEKYDLKPKKYIFIREVSTGTLNYKEQSANIIATFAHRLPKNYQVILSLEDKSTIEQYPPGWILLKEPVEDIHSLIYNSILVISSGDSMAREGAMLGVPSIFCGIRYMKANDIMIDKGMLFKIESEEVPHFVKGIIAGKTALPDQKKFRKKLQAEWDDVTGHIIKQIKKFRR
jgi:hypothetical protein